MASTDLTPNAPVDLSEFRGTFADGWTDDDLRSVLPQINELLCIRIVCLWDAYDDYGFHGHSNLYVDTDEGLATIPDGLWQLLVGGEGDGFIDPTTVGQVEVGCDDYGFGIDEAYGVNALAVGAEDDDR